MLFCRHAKAFVRDEAGRAMALDLNSRPNSLPWPPMIYVVAVAAAFVAQYVAPRTLGADAPARFPGVVMLLAGIALTFWAIRTMRAANTNVSPNRAADSLVTKGPFAISRNPIYLGNTISMLGLAGVVNSLWIVLAAFARGVGFEPRHPSRRGASGLAFRPAWDAYCQRTPRWINADSFGRGRKA